jgi:hypothetical protein
LTGLLRCGLPRGAVRAFWAPDWRSIRFAETVAVAIETLGFSVVDHDSVTHDDGAT